MTRAACAASSPIDLCSVAARGPRSTPTPRSTAVLGVPLASPPRASTARSVPLASNRPSPTPIHPRFELHDLCALRRFSTALLPPSLLRTTWSTVHGSPTLSPSPHREQVGGVFSSTHFLLARYSPSLHASPHREQNAVPSRAILGHRLQILRLIDYPSSTLSTEVNPCLPSPTLLNRSQPSPTLSSVVNPAQASSTADTLTAEDREAPSVRPMPSSKEEEGGRTDDRLAWGALSHYEEQVATDGRRAGCCTRRAARGTWRCGSLDDRRG